MTPQLRTPGETCDKIGCKNPPKFKICLALRVHDKHPPATTSPVLHVCGEHMDVKWDEVVTQEGWAKICMFFIKMGKMAPNKEFSYIEVKPL